MLDLANLILLARTAVNAASELNAVLRDVRGKLSAEDEAELRPYLLKLREENDARTELVLEKLSAAALVDTDGEGRGPATAPVHTRDATS